MMLKKNVEERWQEKMMYKDDDVWKMMNTV